ncbi:Serine/threonine-protein phosphatase 6 regulatory ankyrin repeat subunit A [Homalodisca vitripennis]|nr:Serine/threonine-protein phosphatase 6 regulatory ankyrin repeat subunit A [Homalodisca vitripennis]
MMEGNPFSPVHCAVYQGSEQCLHLMLTYYGPSVVWLRDVRQYTPLHVAALTNSVECCHILLGHHAPVDETDYRGRTPLICAAARGHTLILELLLEYHADVRAKDCQLNTALHHACRNRHSDCALMLLERVQHSSIVNMANKQCKTALHLSARHGLVSVTRRLLEKGASVQVVDCNGLTPALACAPSPAIAQCLSLILTASTQSPIQNSSFSNRMELRLTGTRCSVVQHSAPPLDRAHGTSRQCPSFLASKIIRLDPMRLFLVGICEGKNFKKYTMSLPLLNPQPPDCGLLRTSNHSSDSDFY